MNEKTGKRGRPVKPIPDPNSSINEVFNFLLLFMNMTMAKRVICIILLCVDIPIDRIIELTGLGEQTIRKLKTLISHGKTAIAFVTGFHRCGRHGKAKGFVGAIIDEIESGIYLTLQQIADMISEKFNIKMSIYAVWRLIRKNGIKRLKSGSLPAKADFVEQRNFYEKILFPLMTKANKKRTKTTLLFLDASHFVMGGDFLATIYCRTRRFIKTFSGRKRYNVLGAINFATQKVTTVVNDSYITASEVCEMLRKLIVEYPKRSIHIVLDNARYQKCAIVTNLAQELGIILHYIPPYSPNLNLIERFWKHVKTRLRTKYYDDFQEFKKNINSTIEAADKEDKILVAKLMSCNVQLYDSLLAVTENSFAEKPADKNKLDNAA
jgi:transposase